MGNSLYIFVGAGIFFVILFLSGLRLSRTGKPYNGILFNFHKLIGLTAVVILGMTVFRLHQETPLETMEFLSVGAAGFMFLISAISGGLANIDHPIPGAEKVLHKVTAYLTMIATAVSLYLLLYGL